MVSNRPLLIVILLVVIVAALLTNCMSKQVVYTCEDGTKVFDPDGCPMIDVPVEKPQVENIVMQEEPESLIEKIMEEENVVPAPIPAPVPISDEEEKPIAEPMEVAKATEGFVFNIKNITFTPRTIIAVEYSAENNMEEDVDPYTEIYSIDLETQEKEFLDNFDLGGLKPGQSREKNEGTTIRLKQKEDQLLLFMVYNVDVSSGKVSIANVTHMLNYEE